MSDKIITLDNTKWVERPSGLIVPMTETEKHMKFYTDNYDFIAKYNGLGEENIITAVVHMDEETPHMHLVYIPVVNSKDKKGKPIRKISASDFWKGKDSYKKLQDKFYKYITEKGFDLERGKLNEDNPHRKMKDLKQLTNFYDTKALKTNLSNSKKQMINYSDVQDFYKYEDFTKNNVDNKLIAPLIENNKKLIAQNNKLLLELSKAKNARSYYSTLESQFVEIQKANEELVHKLNLKDIELNACYGVIKQELDKNEKLQKILKEKLGISFDEEKQKTKD